METGSERERRLWRFADCTFDEANWRLSVVDRPIALETKPLELLRILLHRPGELVTKEELLDRVWPSVTVVEASLTTAVHKLRHALGDEHRDPHMIETVPRRGYRLADWVKVRFSALEETTAAESVPVLSRPSRRYTALALAASVVLLVGAGLTWRGLVRDVSPEARAPTLREARSALRRLDTERIEAMLAAGWDPNAAFDEQGNGALNILLEICEWYPGHNRQKLLFTARALVDGGAKLDRRNVWGDTPYSIASADRYCGPDHPVTVAIRKLCLDSNRELIGSCQASYDLARAARLKTRNAARASSAHRKETDAVAGLKNGRPGQWATRLRASVFKPESR